MRYGFYQLHRDLFEDQEIQVLRDRCVSLFQQFEADNKMSMIRVFKNREKDIRSFRQFEDILRWFWSTPLPGLFQAIYQEPPALMVDFLTVRRHQVGSTTSHVNWHADVNFAGATGPMMICWLPLDPVGVSAPGIEFCLPRHKATREILHAGWAKVISAGENSSLVDRDLDRLYGVGNYRIEGHTLDIGDCFVFDRYTVHRTQRLTNITSNRYAVEFRIASSNLAPRELKGNESLIFSRYSHAENRIELLTAAQLYAKA